MPRVGVRYGAQAGAVTEIDRHVTGGPNLGLPLHSFNTLARS